MDDSFAHTSSRKRRVMRQRFSQNYIQITKTACVNPKHIIYLSVRVIASDESRARRLTATKLHGTSPRGEQSSTEAVAEVQTDNRKGSRWVRNRNNEGQCDRFVKAEKSEEWMARSPVWPDDVIASETASRHQPMNWRDSIWVQDSVTRRRSRSVKATQRRVTYEREHVAWSSVWSFFSQWWVGLPCHLWCWSTVFSEVHSQHSNLPGNIRALHASFCWQALWRFWFHFPAGLGTCPHCHRWKLVHWPCCYCAWLARKLAWPEPHWESMGYCQEEDGRHQTQQYRWPEGRYQSNLGFHYTWALPQAICLHATPHSCSNLWKKRPNQVLSA